MHNISQDQQARAMRQVDRSASISGRVVDGQELPKPVNKLPIMYQMRPSGGWKHSNGGGMRVPRVHRFGAGAVDIKQRGSVELEGAIDALVRKKLKGTVFDCWKSSLNEERRAQAEKCIHALIKGWDPEQHHMSLEAIHEAEVDSNSDEGAESSSSGGGGVVHWNPYWEDEEEDNEEDGQRRECGVGTSRLCDVIVERGKCEGCRSIVGCTRDCCEHCAGRHLQRVQQKAVRWKKWSTKEEAAAEGWCAIAERRSWALIGLQNAWGLPEGEALSVWHAMTEYEDG